ncbi:MAG: hypothetical protein H7Y11_07615, partial [Armatimonadetes bacterium]|nr:hypothetical protein [Anaerolineae bacterium]
MSNPRLLALQTGLPARCYPQETITDFYIDLLRKQGKPREQAIRKIMAHSGVASRYSVVEPQFFETVKTTQQRNERYMLEALPLAEEVIRSGLERVGVAPQQIDSLIIVSCTGFNVPGLDLLLARALGMSTSLSRTCIFGMGCYGAFPGIKRALESVQADPNRLALMLSIELCTLHLQFDPSVETVVSTSLFGDGAGMVLVGGAQSALQGPTLLDSETFCDYQTLDQMSFTVTDHGFRMYLSSYIPDVLAANVVTFVSRLLSRHHLPVDAVKFWAIHPGSKRIVDYIQAELT